MSNWKRARSKIPNMFKASSKATYEILWTEDFLTGDTLGETRFDPKQIVIKNGQSDKETVLTLVHECYHALSEEYDIGLTETQVRKLEKASPLLISFLLELFKNERPTRRKRRK